MQPLVPLVFHNLPSLYPPSFRRNDFLYLLYHTMVEVGSMEFIFHVKRADKFIVYITSLSLSTVVLSIGMGPMPAIVDLWGYI